MDRRLFLKTLIAGVASCGLRVRPQTAAATTEPLALFNCMVAGFQFHEGPRLADPRAAARRPAAIGASRATATMPRPSPSMPHSLGKMRAGDGKLRLTDVALAGGELRAWCRERGGPPDRVRVLRCFPDDFLTDPRGEGRSGRKMRPLRKTQIFPALPLAYTKHGA